MAARARVVVTGGAGFIGSHTVHALISRGGSVTVIDDLNTGLRESVVLSVYGADKLGCELQARAAAAAGIPSLGLRLYNVYGTGQHPTSPYSGVISTFVDRALKGEPLTIYGDGTQVRDFIHVDDVAQYMISALVHASTEAPVYNIGTGIETSILDLARMLPLALRSTSGIVFKARRQSDVLRSVADISLAKKIFQFEPQISLWNGLLSLPRLSDDVT